MPYRAPTDELQFILDHVVGFDRVVATERFSEATPDLTAAILLEAGKLASDGLAPLNRVGDAEESRLENGVVRTPTGFAEGFAQIAEGGWIGMAANPAHGGMGLPVTLSMAVNDMFSSACLALQLSPLMTQGQIDALEAHASDAIKNLYLPKLIAGQWAGTMNLTESQAGSNVGALATRAEPSGDGTYAISGQKIFISWGDGDFFDNICHLVLARLPDAAPGTKGISLFMVPKRLPDEDGNPGVANVLRVVSLEHKLGLHGAPTCVMEYDRATGWLVGGEHAGMAAMFTMMNTARLGVGVQGIGVAEAAFQHALAFAQDRKQGRTLVKVGAGTIIDHADVRRMLMTMKAKLFAARAIALDCAVAIDMARATGSADREARAAFLTPIAKAFGTDVGFEVAQLGIQVHGGMGFIEETGAAQFLRDVRVTSIYEGTNGIQAMDLVARKMMDGGAAAFALLDEASTLAKGDIGSGLAAAVDDLRRTTRWLANQTDLNERFAGAGPYLEAFALVLGAAAHVKAAAAEGGDGPRAALARFFVACLLPAHSGLSAAVRTGAAPVYGLTDLELSL